MCWRESGDDIMTQSSSLYHVKYRQSSAASLQQKVHLVVTAAVWPSDTTCRRIFFKTPLVSRCQNLSLQDSSQELRYLAHRPARRSGLVTFTSGWSETTENFCSWAQTAECVHRAGLRECGCCQSDTGRCDDPDQPTVHRHKLWFRPQTTREREDKNLSQ